MKVKILCIFAALLLASIEAFPANETSSSEEIKSENSSKLLEKSTEEITRSKKSSDTVKCKEEKTEDGKSFLKCEDGEEKTDMDTAATWHHKKHEKHDSYEKNDKVRKIST